MFKVGDSVICVDDTPPSDFNGAPYCLVRPKKGELYTIRGIHTEPHIEGYGVYLEECLNPPMIWSCGDEAEWPFASTRFRRTLLRRAVRLEAAEI